MTKSKTLHTYILLDRSGSMQTNWDESLTAINTYVSKTAEDKGKTKVTVAAFDSQMSGLDFDVLRDGVNSRKWKDLTSGDATPRGMTPLFDALGRIVSMAKENNKKSTTLIVMTDGMENTSVEVTKDKAKDFLDQCKKKGWEVLFLGADFNAFGEAANVGVAMGKTMNMTKGNYASTMSSFADKTRSYANTGAAVEFSDEDRKKASS